MTPAEISIVMLVLVGLTILRFGVPILIMWLLNQVCCRVLRLKS